ncbi:hypothetical protein B9G69_012915 [Bdellovibrio sp. SKB1291214]|uniref:hypothetical protein n=1 Tax=Bdellovibrio sp. SKB1291214 TaxID=1732569 RepID=UPI001131249F|nr:hypothetical protein [Bdellovibrio sp. SKB1291214]UYL07948.1 hypothetical protein B9G69_012915 [Bdellovibrio sp. SKB1291214]
MSQTNDLYKLMFPWDEVLPASAEVIVRDVDVVGVGAIRKHQLLKLKAEREIILQTHTGFIPASVRAIYDEELQRTLQWLQPTRVIASKEFNFHDEVLKAFVRIFPKTHEQLGVMNSKLCAEYLKEMEWSSWLLQDHWRYFSGFIRQKFASKQTMVELVQWEWIRAWLEIQPFEMPPAGTKQLVVNPSLQTLKLSHDNDVIQRTEGLYTFVCNQESVKILERKIEICEAALLDLLNEDRAFSEERLLEMAMLEDIQPPLSKDDWRKKIEVLLGSSLILKT